MNAALLQQERRAKCATRDDDRLRHDLHLAWGAGERANGDARAAHDPVFNQEAIGATVGEEARPSGRRLIEVQAQA